MTRHLSAPAAASDPSVPAASTLVVPPVSAASLASSVAASVGAPPLAGSARGGSLYPRYPGYTPRRDGGLGAYEVVLGRAGFAPVAGIDEAGRGACAGPLVVAAVDPADVMDLADAMTPVTAGATGPVTSLTGAFGENERRMSS